MKVLIVDDHDVIRQSMAMIIQSEYPHAVCTKLENAESCIKILQKESFELLILDMNLPDMDGITLTEWIMEHFPDQLILIFSMNPTGVFAKRLYEIGAKGYLNKQADMSDIRKALRTILTEKKQYISDELKTMLSQNFLTKKAPNPIEKLSKRELSIAQLLAQGKTFDEIAVMLSIEPATIRTYKGRIFQKLEVNTLHEFLAKASLYKIF